MKPIKNHIEKRMLGNYNIYANSNNILRSTHYRIKKELVESPK